MAELIFNGFLPMEEKPEHFEEFRNITSELLSDLEGKLVFSYVSTYQQFDISENTTNKTYSEIRKILGDDSKYLI
ncbi:hypothetical protein Celal_3325 [Cellulophaga algicola DSM 14237]|uniref:Uncharacterized protein n=1 Tax=Cellulophaga algicola (strain DSM 14237 / IC166 / ACAM 630) TaxID=688270 RepID=E6X632_CELAD|nr:hypothetical protein [Cellulophaga algicola]ADV50591.1 hypothetical protein Celal_3325 [Cellulophaga algicola DSM 14237]